MERPGPLLAAQVRGQPPLHGTKPSLIPTSPILAVIIPRHFFHLLIENIPRTQTRRRFQNQQLAVPGM